MKRLKQTLLAALVMMLALSAGTYGSAEDTKAWKADLTALLDASEIPSTTTITYDLSIPEGAEVQEKAQDVELVSTRGDVLNVRVVFELVNLPLSDSQWSEVGDWVKSVVTASVQSVQADSESLANVVANGLAEQRKAAQGDWVDLSVWQSDNLMIQSVSASVPYYPELQSGSSGAATQRLQRRLIELGFLSGAADGHYGANTEKAVQALEQHVRVIEQGLIDNRPDPTPTPQPTATPTPAPYVVPLSIEVPIVTPEPTVEPTLSPETAVDGVADPLLQAYAFSEKFQSALGILNSGDSGDQVLRVQRRLANLGYMTDAADGQLGAGTMRSLRIFQYYNGLIQTGIADIATQELLFSADARRPDNAMLSEGASGEEVSRLQKRLRVLGFAAINVDGSYGASTKIGVENLQKYLQEMETETLADSGGATPSTVINGVADPILLEDFYADSFPAVPAELSDGSSGRDVVRLQRRLNLLEYYYGALDGAYGEGTAKAVRDFQKRHGLEQTGVADTQTLQTLFDENALKALKPYVLKVSVKDQKVYAYGLDENNEYTDLVKTMKCSTGRKGNETPLGTYENGTGPGARWHYFKKFDCWAQYAFYIQGDIMFHSVLYGAKEGSVTRSSVNNLGRRASHGCVRLSVDDAKWVWSNCPRNTKVIVY